MADRDPSLKLLEPFRLGTMPLANRMVMAPMTRNRATGQTPTPLMAEYYRQRAGAGLIVTEATQVSPRGVGYPETPGIHAEHQIEGWRPVVDAVHEAGGRIFLQLWHVGRISHPSLQPDGALPVAPSAVAPEGKTMTYQGPQTMVTPRALEAAEIPGIVAAFRQGAENARDAGFDGVEIHGANGYLIDQFLRDGSNRRDDGWGGSAEKRVRFLREVAEAVAGAWAADRTGVRLSPLSAFNSMRDSDPRTTFSTAVRALDELGLAYLHVVEQNDFQDTELDFDLDELREIWSGAYVANGGYDRERGEDALRTGRADLVSFGRPFLANPDLPERFAEDAPLNEPDPDTFYGGDEEGYVDYPTLEEAA